jgi:outer membrane lipoprotein-sorting protein
MMALIGTRRGCRGVGRGAGWRWPWLALGLALAMLTPLAVAAADPLPQSVALSAQDRGDLQRIAAYLNSIGTMTARFHQYSANGGTAAGWLWLDRPGRMRFQYDPPDPILLLADRFYIYYIDTQLAEVSQVGLKSTPAWFLLRVPISFDDLVVTHFERIGNTLRVTTLDPNNPDNGSLTMVFNAEPLSLREWTIVDQQRRVTTVALSQQQFGMALDPNLFVYQNPYVYRPHNEN